MRSHDSSIGTTLTHPPLYSGLEYFKGDVDVTVPDTSIPKWVFRISNVLARVRSGSEPLNYRWKSGSVPVNYKSGPVPVNYGSMSGLDPTLDFSDFQDAKKLYFFVS